MTRAFGPMAPSTAAALLTLHFHGPLTGTQVSRILRLSQPATVRLIDKLAAADLIARTEKRDGRDIPISLTETGENSAKALLAARDTALAEVMAPLSPEKRALLAGLLDEMLPATLQSREEARFLCRFCDHGICDGDACPIGCRATELENAETESPE